MGYVQVGGAKRDVDLKDLYKTKLSAPLRQKRHSFKDIHVVINFNLHCDFALLSKSLAAAFIP